MNLNSLQNQRNPNFVSQPLLLLPIGSKPHERLRTQESFVAQIPQNQFYSNFYLNTSYNSISQQLKTLKDNNNKVNRLIIVTILFHKSKDEQKYTPLIGSNDKKLITQICGYNQPYKFGNSKDNTPFLTSKKPIARADDFSSNRIFSADLRNKQLSQRSEINCSKQSLFLVLNNQKSITARQYDRNQHINKTLNDELQTSTPELKKSKHHKGIQLNINSNQIITGKQKKQEKDKLLDQYVTRVKNNNHLCINMSPNRNIDKYRSLSPLQQNTEHIYYQTNAVKSWKKSKLGELAKVLGFVSASLYNLLHPTQYRPKRLKWYSILQCSNVQQNTLKIKQKNTIIDKKTVVFDLDETLVHCVDGQQYNFLLEIEWRPGQIQGHMHQSSQNHQVRSVRLYYSRLHILVMRAKLIKQKNNYFKVIEKLDPEKRLFSKVLFRDKCIVTQEGVYVKDIRVIGRDLKDIVLVDNATYSFGTFLNNGIPIIPFYDNKLDTELKSLQNFLFNEILDAYDVRTVLSKHFQLMHWMKFATAKDSVLNLYDS